MNFSNTEMDMLKGALPKKILLFSLPIALSSMLQQLFNAADTSIVGYFDNADSLAAVGTNGEITALIVTVSSGLSIGANVLIANRIGMKKTNNISSIINTSILLACLVGILGLICGQFIAKPLLMLIQTPENILGKAEIYLRIYFIGYPFLLIYDFVSAILRARGDSLYPFIALTLSGITNVILNLVFVIIFHMGVTGVAVATVISTLFSAVIVICRLKKANVMSKFTFKRLNRHFPYMLLILKTGIPSAIQGAVFCFANFFVQAAINGFGSEAIAGCTIAMTFEYFAYYVITAFGQTATTFTSQNYAAGQIKRCRQILLICTVFSILSSSLIIVPIILFKAEFSGIFSTNEAVITNACLRITCILVFEPMCCLYEIPSGVLRGCGHALQPALITIIGTCAFRIIWIYTVFRHFHSLEILYAAFPITWVITTALMLISFLIIRPFSPRNA